MLVTLKWAKPDAISIQWVVELKEKLFIHLCSVTHFSISRGETKFRSHRYLIESSGFLIYAIPNNVSASNYKPFDTTPNLYLTIGCRCVFKFRPKWPWLKYKQFESFPIEKNNNLRVWLQTWWKDQICICISLSWFNVPGWYIALYRRNNGKNGKFYNTVTQNYGIWQIFMIIRSILGNCIYVQNVY